ncbi:MAG TPA: hypothetical protein VMR34_03950 [Candidatus Saccharimonadales bacterium]|nr:hypothetical protein [Candidatus Saccharimonadales bacterium]
MTSRKTLKPSKRIVYSLDLLIPDVLANLLNDGNITSMIGPEKGVVSPNAEEVTLSLEILGSLNPYMESVVGAFHDAIEAHENGDDLRQFLYELKFIENYYNNIPKHLNDKQIGIVLAGRTDEGAATDYMPRVGFAIGLSSFGDTFSAHGIFDHASFKTYDELQAALKESSRPKDGSSDFDYFEWSIESMTQQDITKQLFGNARRAGADGLDIEYDGNGRKIDMVDEINHVMADFCMQLDQPELAESFAGQIVGDDKKVSLYFSAIRSGNMASLKVLDLFADLKDQLDPHQLVRFLTLEISQQGLSGEVDIADNARRIITLTNDEHLFDSKYRKAIRTKLILALSEAGQTSLSDRVAELCGLNKIREQAQVVVKTGKEKAKKLSRKERKSIRSLGKAATRNLEVSFGAGTGINVIADKRDDFMEDALMNLHPKKYAKFTLYMRQFSLISAWDNKRIVQAITDGSEEYDFRDFIRRIGVNSRSEAKMYEELFYGRAERTPDRKFQELVESH